MKNIYEKQIVQLLKKHGTLRWRDFVEMQIPSIVLSRMVKQGALERVARGLYRKPNTQMSEREEMVNVALRVPRAVFCLFTALQFYELTTQLPRDIWIAMPHGSRKPKIAYPPIEIIRLTGKTYSEGINTVVCDQVPLKIYSPAKTIVDCFKFRNKIGLDIALEALKDALQKRLATYDEIYYFAKIERLVKIILPYLEAVG